MIPGLGGNIFGPEAIKKLSELRAGRSSITAPTPINAPFVTPNVQAPVRGTGANVLSGHTPVNPAQSSGINPQDQPQVDYNSGIGQYPRPQEAVRSSAARRSSRNDPVPPVVW